MPNPRTGAAARWVEPNSDADPIPVTNGASADSRARSSRGRTAGALATIATGAAAGDAGRPASSTEESRSFLQQRLAFLGKAEALLGFGFFTAGNLVALLLPSDHWKEVASTHSRLLVPASSMIYLIAWLVCRRGHLSSAALLAIDAAVALATAVLGAFMVFAHFPGEVAGFSYARMLQVITFGFVIRAVIVPSSARRTLLLGLVITAFTVATSHFWYRNAPGANIPAGIQGIWTTLWCLGAVAIATLASHVIFGLRRQVREAWQLGQYTLLEKIGEGNMGSVYRASHAMLRRPTAVKLLPPDKAGADQLRRFEREVQLTSLLTHPSTVVVFDYGRTADGVFYYAMEYLEGLDLEQLVLRDGPQPAGRVVHILRQIAGSLAEAHSVGLIHRDIKPANVILVPERGGESDVAKVVDFGLVKDLDRDTDLSRDDMVAGTPHYMSPEVITAPDSVDARSDLYSLGCVGYYLLTGQRVFEGRTVVEVCSNHLHSQPVPPALRLGNPVPESLAALLLACLEKDPSRRPQSAREFMNALEASAVHEWTRVAARTWWSDVGTDLLAGMRRATAREPGLAAGQAPHKDVAACGSFLRRAG